MFQISKEILGAKSIAISGHIRPDGDCVGSCMALYLYLKKITDAEVSVYLQKPSDIFLTLKGVSEIKESVPNDKVYDVIFVLDCDASRLGDAEVLFHTAKKVINVDHHMSNDGCGAVNYISKETGSASELVYDLLKADGAVLDVEIAKAIYTGMIHDTGVFQYSNTTPKTMRIAADLLEYGFDFYNLISNTFYEKTYVQNQIMGRALLESFLFLDGKCIVSAVDKRLMDFYNVTSKDLSGIINQLRLTKGVECAIFMYETDTLEYKISMRSSDKVDVSKIAVYFGGGGHKKAAGCTMSGTFHDVVNNLSLHIEQQLNGEEG